MSGQSLSGGATGIALLHLEQARIGAAPWDSAFATLTDAVADGVSTGMNASLYHGAPALSFVLHGAADHAGLLHAKDTVDTATVAIVEQRLKAAHERIDRRERPKITEYDLISGLTGLGVVVRRSGNDDLLRQILAYVVRLTEPIDGLPGWWTPDSHQRSKPAPPGGHSNHGLAHGITGPLTLLALTRNDGVEVDGQVLAITRICEWLDQWEQDLDGRDLWWPKTVTLTEIESGRPLQAQPHQPSWCYGTPGITRALHAAARALGDDIRQEKVESALSDCLADPAQLARLTERNLCHGTGGVLTTARRIAADARTHVDLAPILTWHRHTPVSADEPSGFLTGAAGATLADLATTATSWDACLLLS
jgi:hypothetical protein